MSKYILFLGLICTLTAIGHCGILDTVDGVRQGVKLANNLNSGYDYMGDIFGEVKDQVGKVVNTAMSDDSPVGGIVDTIGEVAKAGGQIASVQLVNNLMKDDSPPEGLGLGDFVGAVGQGVKLANNLNSGYDYIEDILGKAVNTVMSDDSLVGGIVDTIGELAKDDSPPEGEIGEGPIRDIVGWPFGQDEELVNNLMKDDSPPATTTEIPAPAQPQNSPPPPQSLLLGKLHVQLEELANNLMKDDSSPATTTEIPVPAQPQNSPPAQSMLVGKLQVQLIQPQNLAPLQLLGKFKLQLVRA